MRIIHIRPKAEFSGAQEICSYCPGFPLNPQNLHLFEVPLLSIIVDRCGLPIPIVNQFLTHIALRSRSVLIFTKS
uniref:Uncharacterized protein n=1 Tax=Pandoraea norimbergensis TaxID=93219 RepID=A0ABM5WIG4_9BURK